jgi:hypothetical protein
MATHSFEIATSIAIPTVTYLINWRIRKSNNLEYTSSAADLVLAVWTFDLVVLTAEAVFKSAVRNDVLLQNFNSVAILLFLFSILVWGGLLFRLKEGWYCGLCVGIGRRCQI